jgi:hypothetical protein
MEACGKRDVQETRSRNQGIIKKSRHFAAKESLKARGFVQANS